MHTATYYLYTRNRLHSEMIEDIQETLQHLGLVGRDVLFTNPIPNTFANEFDPISYLSVDKDGTYETYDVHGLSCRVSFDSAAEILAILQSQTGYTTDGL